MMSFGIRNVVDESFPADYLADLTDFVGIFIESTIYEVFVGSSWNAAWDSFMSDNNEVVDILLHLTIFLKTKHHK